MAIPKADGRGKESLYFGFNLDFGGGCRWSQAAFETPLRIALGGQLNRQLGFATSRQADQVLAYTGDGFQWGPKSPMAQRSPLDRDSGPVCRA
jgi:hypothetical protein